MFSRFAKLAVALMVVPSIAAAQGNSNQNPVNCVGTVGGAFYASTFNWGTGISYVDCIGAISGNDNGNQAGLVNAQWSAAYGIFSPVNGGTSDGPGNGPFTSVDGAPLSFDDPISGYFAVTLKQASYFSIYLFYASDPVESMFWDTRGVASNGGANNPDKLSHAVLYAPPSTPMTKVPEPSSILLLVAGLTGLGAATVRRTRR